MKKIELKNGSVINIDGNEEGESGVGFYTWQCQRCGSFVTSDDPYCPCAYMEEI